MPRASIDYLNSRKDLKPASGGRRYANERNAVDDRAQYRALDIWERTMMDVDAIQAEFRSWSSNRRPVAAVMSDNEDDWF